MPQSRSLTATPPVMLLCGPGDPLIIAGLLKVTALLAASGRSVRLCVSDDLAELREALFAPVPVIIWDGHGDPGPKVDNRYLNDLLDSGGRRITAEVLVLGCCQGRSREFTDVIRRYLAGPAAFAGCENQPGRSHGPDVFPPLLEVLAPLTGTGAAPQSLADAMNAALGVLVRDHPRKLGPAHWGAQVLQPL